MDKQPQALADPVPQDQARLARMFRALGDPTRLRIFEFLRGCCCPVAVEDSGDVRPVYGPTVGEVCCTVTGADRITSTVSVHLKTLEEAGLITIQPRGKTRVCGVNQDAVVALADYLNMPRSYAVACSVMVGCLRYRQIASRMRFALAA